MKVHTAANLVDANPGECDEAPNGDS